MTHWFSNAFSTYILHVQHGNGYQWWSGAGSDLSYLAIFLVLVRLGGQYYKHHLTCHIDTCNRPARYKIDGTPYKVCRIHHPEVPNGKLTADHVNKQHEIAKANQNRVQ